MADSSGRGGSRERRPTDTPDSTRPQAVNGRQQTEDFEHLPTSFASPSEPGGSNGATNSGGTRATGSHFSWDHDQFAASHGGYGLEEDEESEHLEAAPVIANFAGIYEDAANEDWDLSDSTIQRLLDINKAESSYDYYTLLGLSRDPPPTTADIRRAYHRVSLALHPDKHPQGAKAAAERQFTKLQKAYETLIEPRKRIIYDLEGEEGLRMEYSAGGSMGKGGEAEKKQIGVKTMSAAEFKRWFIGILKDRERRAIEELVSASGAYKVTLNAVKLFDGSPRHETFRPLEGGGPILEIQVPTVSITAVELKQSFSVPLSSLGRLLEEPVNNLLSSADNVEDDVDDGPSPRWQEVASQNVPRLTIMGSIGGGLEDQLAIDRGDSAQTTHKPVHWHHLSTESMFISAGLEHSFAGAAKGDDASVASVLQGLDVDITTGLLPKRTFSVGLGRMFSIAPDTRPFYGHLMTSVNESLHLKPPLFDLRVSRSLGARQTGYCQWSSGDFRWPSLISDVLPVSKLDLWLPRGRMLPSMRTGWVWSEGRSTLQVDEDQDLYGNPSTGDSKDAAPTSNQSWHVAASASPLNTSMSITYGRDVFVRSPERTIRSRIMNNGEAALKDPRPRIDSVGGVRLEIEAEVSLALSFGGCVRGVRRVGDFSTVGVGVGLKAERGLYISLSWSRLSQKLALPIILIPMEEVSSRAAFWALALPWAAYAAVEFVILRPRLQQKRLKLLERKRKELVHNVVRRKQEAEQAVLLMLPLVEHRQAIEREQGGLVITNAEYGAVDSTKHGKTKFLAGESANVTVALAALVDSGQVSLPKGLHKSHLVGWWDPAPLKKKSLSIDYLFGGKQHHVEIQGNANLSIPMRDHEI
ncbi:MAG: hypothetical protein M1818_002013 [Claussenomyces sp. TS43310]|nr:MAG: hypothetical protein M1818_002013 [Claussenomyces sp. TS43310]